MNERPLRILFVSSLFPSSVEPGRAPYNRQLIAAIARRAEVRVIAPVPWFPGQRLLRRRVLPPETETLDGLLVSHPRAFYTPGCLIHKHWRWYQKTVRAHLKETIAAYRPDHIIVGFAYPDGVAVGPLCREWGVPYSIRVNGSDFRLRIKQPRFRGLVLSALRDTRLLFCPGQALKRDMAAAGIDNEKIVAFQNGINPDLFRYRTRDESVAALRATGAWPKDLSTDTRFVLFAGHLEWVKGADRLLRAWAILYEAWRRECETRLDAPLSRARPKLLIVGRVGGGKRLRRLARQLAIADGVRFLGERPHAEIALWMNAAECLCLPSRSEGSPNVVVEALAVGLPVVATGVGEVPFLVKDGTSGLIVEHKYRGVSSRLAVALESTLEREFDRQELATAAEKPSWDEAAAGILAAVRATATGSRSAGCKKETRAASDELRAG